MFFSGLLIRLLSGEDVLSIPPVIKWPGYDEVDGQLFPFKTVIMLINTCTLYLVSIGVNYYRHGTMTRPWTPLYTEDGEKIGETQKSAEDVAEKAEASSELQIIILLNK